MAVSVGLGSVRHVLEQAVGQFLKNALLFVRYVFAIRYLFNSDSVEIFNILTFSRYFILILLD